MDVSVRLMQGEVLCGVVGEVSKNDGVQSMTSLVFNKISGQFGGPIHDNGMDFCDGGVQVTAVGGHLKEF